MKIEELNEWFKSEEGQKSLDSFTQSLIEEDDNRREFELTIQPKVMEKLLAELNVKGTINDEDLLYFPEKYDVTSEEFHLLFDNIQNYTESKKLTFTDSECPFANYEYHCSYKDKKLAFITMHGQGTARWIKLCPDDEWHNEISFKYDDYRNEISQISPLKL